MKKQEKEKIIIIIEQCINSFQSWDKKSVSVFKILEQMSGLKKSKWELFDLSHTVKEKVEESLKIRLYEELSSLSGEITFLKLRLQELDKSKSSLQSCCSEINERKATRSMEIFCIFSNLCTCFHLIIGIKQVPLRRISIKDLESFQFLKDSNASAIKVIEQFQENVDTWKERIL